MHSANLRHGVAIAAVVTAAMPALARPVAGAGPQTVVQPAAQAADATADITVTATRGEKRVEDVPQTVSVIDANTIDDRLVTDIKDLVRYEPGVAVRRAPARFTAAGAATGRDRDSGFNIRGLEGNRVLLTVDGVRVPDAFSFGAQSVGRGDYVDLDLIRSVEILRGPASALYGSDGVAGAVSFITKDPQDFLHDGNTVGGGVRIGYDGSDESWTKGIVVAGRQGDVQAMIAYTRRDGHALGNRGTNDSADTDRTTPNPQDVESNALLARLVWTPGDDSRIRLTYERFASAVDTQVLSAITRPSALGTLAATAVRRLDAHDTVARDRGTIDYRYTGPALLGIVSGIRAAAYYQDSGTVQTGWEDRNTAADRIRINRFDNRVWGGTLQLESRARTGPLTHLFAYGVDYSHTLQTGVRDGTVPPAGETYPARAFPTTGYGLIGIFAQDEIAVADGVLTLFPAIRYDRYRLAPQRDALFTSFVPRAQDGSRVTPRIGAVAKLTEGIRLFANYGQGFKPPEPNQVNNGFANLAQGYRSIPNPELKPETSRSVEGGVRLNGTGWSLGGTAFRSHFRDFIDQRQVGGRIGNFTDPATFQFVNWSRVRIEGLEARGEARLPIGLGVRAAAAYAKGTMRTTGVAAALPLDSVEPVKVVAGLFYQPDDGPFRAEFVATHSSGKNPSDTNNGCNAPAQPASPFAPATPATVCFTPAGFWVFDATASLRVAGRATIRAGVFNITDRRYFWWSDVRGLTSTSIVRDAFSQPGRNAGAALSLRF